MARSTQDRSAPHEYCTLTDDEVRKFLGKPERKVMNLGHECSESQIGDSIYEVNYPAPRPTRGVSGRMYTPPDENGGLASADNLDVWSKRASANSYRGLVHKTPREDKRR